VFTNTFALKLQQHLLCSELGGTMHYAYMPHYSRNCRQCEYAIRGRDLKRADAAAASVDHVISETHYYLSNVTL